MRHSNPSPLRLTRGWAVGLCASAVLLAGAVGPAHAAQPSGAASADDLLVVDCLLPGQIRQLGNNVRYVTARRPIKTSAHECRMRGGEYVAYDQAGYGAALKMWLPLAEQGDPEAQTYLGEIHEKGLGMQADYAGAAKWYRAAADQGYSRAQINLGQLYEKGLGVPKDPVQALNWYRKAAGVADAVIMDSGTLQANRREVEQLRETVQEQRQEADFLRRQLQDTEQQLEEARKQLRQREQTLQQERRGLEQARAQLQQQRAGAVAAQDVARVAALDEELHARSEELAQKDRQLSSLQGEIARVRAEAERHQERLAMLESSTDEVESLRREVEQSRTEVDLLQARLRDSYRQLEQARSESRQKGEALTEQQQRLARIRSELESKQNASVRDDAAIERLQEELQRREADLARQQEEMQRLKQEVARVESESQHYKAALAEAEKPASAPAAEAPQIEMIDPQLVATRGVPEVVLRGALSERMIVGKIVAAGGLMSLTVNDQPLKPNEEGVFRTTVPLGSDRTPVSVVAIDHTGARSVTSFELVQPVAESRTQMAGKDTGGPSPSSLAGVSFGNYHALIIGNNAYTSLPKLQSAINDAEAVDALLRTRYGFKTRKLINATRYEILSALNEMRAQLTDEDNLLIYYAGHGELDRANLRGHWLPVDAEPGSSANWISVVAVTDILNAMNAKQVLVVADSCYSGALTRSALGHLEAGLSESAKVNWLRVMAKKRARTVLTSGGLKPVLDTSRGDHSIFAQAFIDVLKGNEGVIEGRRLFEQISERVTRAASELAFEQVPEYAPIQFAGHEGGDFFFLPRI